MMGFTIHYTHSANLDDFVFIGRKTSSFKVVGNITGKIRHNSAGTELYVALQGIINRGERPAALSIEIGDDSLAVIHHPLVAKLKNIFLIRFTDVDHEVGRMKHSFILPLPLIFPLGRKSRPRHRRNQMKRRIAPSPLNNNLSGPEINAHRHPGDKRGIAIRNRLINLFFQPCFNCCLICPKFFGTMPGKTTANFGAFLSAPAV